MSSKNDHHRGREVSGVQYHSGSGCSEHTAYRFKLLGITSNDRRFKLASCQPTETLWRWQPRASCNDVYVRQIHSYRDFVGRSEMCQRMNPSRIIVGLGKVCAMSHGVLTGPWVHELTRQDRTALRCKLAVISHLCNIVCRPSLSTPPYCV